MNHDIEEIIRTKLQVDSYIKRVFAGRMAAEANKHDKLLIAHTLVFLGLAMFETSTSSVGNVVTIHCCFESTETLRLLMDQSVLLLPFKAQN